MSSFPIRATNGSEESDQSDLTEIRWTEEATPVADILKAERSGNHDNGKNSKKAQI